MPRSLRFAAVATALLVFTNGPVFFVARNLTADSGGWEGDLIKPTFIAVGMLAAATAALDLARRGSAELARPHGVAAAAIAAYTLVAIASTAWSVAPELTLWRSLVYVGLALLAWVMADMGREVRIPLGLMAAAAVGASLLALKVAENQAFGSRGPWRGVYIARNSLAALAALGLLVGIHILLTRLKRSELPEQTEETKPTEPPEKPQHPEETQPNNRDRRRRWELAAGATLGLALLWTLFRAKRTLFRAKSWLLTKLKGAGINAATGLGLLVGIHILLTRLKRSELPEQTEETRLTKLTPLVPVVWLGWWGLAAGATLGAASLWTLFGTRSRTVGLSLVGALAVSALGWAYPRLRQRFGPRAATWSVLGAAAVGLVGLVAVTAALWQESTFVKRRINWGLVWDYIADRPLTGHGFFAFWEVPELIAAHERLMYDGSAHNSALEVLLGTGLIGLAPFAVIAVAAAFNAGRDLVRDPGADTWLWAAVVAFALFQNVAESFVLWFSYNWVIIMAAALRCPGPRRLPPEPDPTPPADGRDGASIGVG